MTEKHATGQPSSQSAGDNPNMPPTSSSPSPSVVERASTSTLQDPADATESPAPIDVSEESQGITLNAHNKYFFEDGNLWLRVEDVDFKVHRYFFMRDSAKFRELSRDGLRGRVQSATVGKESDAIPLVLENVTSSDFEFFLSVLYPTLFGKDDAKTVLDWTSILQVSIYLEFNSIRELSVEKLTAIATPVDKIVIGRKFGIKHWLRDAYRELCMRLPTLTKEEGKKLGVEEVVGIMEARQAIFWETSNMDLTEGYQMIENIFGLDPPSTSDSHPKVSKQPQPRNIASSRPPQKRSPSTTNQPSTSSTETSAQPASRVTQQPYAQVPQGKQAFSFVLKPKMTSPVSGTSPNGAAAPPFTFTIKPSTVPTNTATPSIFTFGPSKFQK